MQKIMFNDRYCLTQAVLDGRKTMTRRGDGINPVLTDVYDNSVERFNRGHIDHIELIGCKRAWAYKPRYKVGDIVAVAQSYKTFPSIIKSPELGGLISLTTGTLLQDEKGWSNKLFARADLMPNQIRITAVRAERLQDITDEECIKEGVHKFTPNFPEDFPVHPTYFTVRKIMENTPRKAFASLIDKVSGKGTWNRNPWVWVYEFELVK